MVAELAAVLGGAPSRPIDPARPLTELGITSVNAIELRNRLMARTGVTMPATLVFDHPTPHAIVRLIRTSLAPAADTPDELITRLERLLADGTTLDAAAAARLRALARRAAGSRRRRRRRAVPSPGQRLADRHRVPPSRRLAGANDGQLA
nr:hypothetical protein GCM10020092_032400 [Actinoplanes digitatis]